MRTTTRQITFIAAAVVTCLLAGAATDAGGEGVVPSDLARNAFGNDGGYSFRVTFDDGGVTLKRTDYTLPGKGAVTPAYNGAAVTICEILFPDGARRTAVKRDAWDHQTATYVAGGATNGMGQTKGPETTTVVVSRLTPAVLIDTQGKSIAFRAGEKGFSHVAFVTGGKVVVRPAGRLDGAVRLDEPWLLAWFAKDSPYRGYRGNIDVNDEHYGPDKVHLTKYRRPVTLDVPILFRLERRPASIRHSSGTLTLDFDKPAGKLAVMCAFGGKAFEPSETQGWSKALPDKVVAHARRWSAKLRDYPMSVKETFSVDAAKDALTINQDFTWASFDDDWNTPPARSAPVPPMLALALGGGVPVTFHQNGKQVHPVDYQLMDTPGKAAAIDGADSYSYRITGLGRYLFHERKPAPPSDADAKYFQDQLEKHVTEMIDSGHLAPLFYVYGGIGGAGASYFYWASSPELAQALHLAWPYLSEPLRRRAVAYLKQEWKLSPPFQVNNANYRKGASRAPYEVPWQDAGRGAGGAYYREASIRQWHFFGDLYGVWAFDELTGGDEGSRCRDRAVKRAGELLAKQDWALCSPVERRKTSGFWRGVNYFDRNGQASCNVRLAGAIATVRLARKYGWQDTEKLAWYLFGKLALARVGMARYTAELHRMGLVDGPPQRDWRTLVHVDRTCVLTYRGHISTVVREDQEIPPFIGLVEEVGLLLGAHARQECGYYLDNLDRSMSLWYLSEAPKQSGSEHRLCPLQHKSGNVLAQYWVLGRCGEAFRRYVDVTRFKGDLYYIQNLAALIESYSGPAK